MRGVWKRGEDHFNEKPINITKLRGPQYPWGVSWGFNIPGRRYTMGHEVFANRGQALTFAKKLHKEMRE